MGLSNVWSMCLAFNRNDLSNDLSKNLRNGPCGRVRENGHCEVKPEMRCVWLKGFERSQNWPLPNTWKEEFNHLRPPVDHRLKGDSSWINFFTKRDKWTPKGWKNSSEIMDKH